MDPATTDPQPKEARTLAAIVFTDVVGFSKLAAQNEARVYGALQRDMGVMTNLCRAHGGQVLNTMGDGMLLCFTSAVDAMSCAVEIQRTLHNQSLSLPPVEVLHHRIGVHLGDVIMNGDNVFGDGVNVAARLQAMAKPDAVCFSSTVYDIIKNKMKLDATYLGPQQLKNLGEPVKIWQVPPLSAPVLAQDVQATMGTPEVTTGASGVKGAILLVVCLVLLGGLGFGIAKLQRPPPMMPTHTKKNGEKPKPTETADATTGTSTTSAQTDGSTTAPTGTVTREQVTKTLQDRKNAYDFRGIVAELEKNGQVVPEELAKKDEWTRLEPLQEKMNSALTSAANLSSAISVPGLTLNTGRQPAQVYLDAQSSSFMAQTNSGGIFPLSPLQAQNYAEIAKAVLANSGTDSAQADELLQLFCKEYGISVPTDGP